MGKTGTSSVFIRAPGEAERMRQEKIREEQEWAAKCGPVEVSYLSPEELAERKKRIRKLRRARSRQPPL